MFVSGPAASQSSSKAPHKMIPAGMGLQFFLVTALFFLWGMPNNLNDVLIRQFMTSFALTRFKAGLVQSAFYLGYFFLATPAALLMRKYGYKFGFVAGLLLFGAGAFLFWPAAVVDEYWFFLAALFVIAAGLSFLETASNPFVAQMGDPATAARRLNFAQAFNPLGAISGVLIGTVFIFSGIELTPAQTSAMKLAGTYRPYLRHETMRVVTPYLVIGAFVLLWAFLIAVTKFPRIESEHEGEAGGHGHFSELLRQPNFLFAVLAQFMYVGAQVCTWSYFIQYIQETAHQPEKTAGYILTGTLVAFGAGRFSSTEIMRRVRPDRLMGLYAVINVALVAIGVLSPGWIGIGSIFLTSFFMSVMYPTIFALGIEGLGPNTKIAGSFIVMAIIGGGVLTPFMGWISQLTHSIALAYLVPLGCYVVVAFYSYVGHRLGKPRGAGVGLAAEA